MKKIKRKAIEKGDRDSEETRKDSLETIGVRPLAHGPRSGKSHVEKQK